MGIKKHGRKAQGMKLNGKYIFGAKCNGSIVYTDTNTIPVTRTAENPLIKQMNYNSTSTHYAWAGSDVNSNGGYNFSATLYSSTASGVKWYFTDGSNPRLSAFTQGRVTFNINQSTGLITAVIPKETSEMSDSILDYTGFRVVAEHPHGRVICPTVNLRLCVSIVLKTGNSNMPSSITAGQYINDGYTLYPKVISGSRPGAKPTTTPDAIFGYYYNKNIGASPWPVNLGTQYDSTYLTFGGIVSSEGFGYGRSAGNGINRVGTFRLGNAAGYDQFNWTWTRTITKSYFTQQIAGSDAELVEPGTKLTIPTQSVSIGTTPKTYTLFVVKGDYQPIRDAGFVTDGITVSSKRAVSRYDSTLMNNLTGNFAVWGSSGYIRLSTEASPTGTVTVGGTGTLTAMSSIGSGQDYIIGAAQALDWSITG